MSYTEIIEHLYEHFWSWKHWEIQTLFFSFLSFFTKVTWTCFKKSILNLRVQKEIHIFITFLCIIFRIFYFIFDCVFSLALIFFSVFLLIFYMFLVCLLLILTILIYHQVLFLISFSCSYWYRQRFWWSLK